MKIAIDLDDVTVSIVNELSIYRNTLLKTAYTLENYTTFDISKVWKCTPKEAMQSIYDFYESPFMDMLPPIPGAIAGIKKLSEKHDIFFLTSRPVWIQEKTEAWIQKHFKTKQFPVYFTNQFSPEGSNKVKKSDVCLKRHADVIFEDSPEYALDCASKGIEVFLLDKPWNKEIKNEKNITRVKNWDEILSLI